MFSKVSRKLASIRNICIWDVLIILVSIFLVIRLFLGREVIQEKISNALEGSTQTPQLSNPIQTITKVPQQKSAKSFPPTQAAQTAYLATGSSVRRTQEYGEIQTQEFIIKTSIPETLEARKAQCKDGFILEQELEILKISNDNWTIYTCSPALADENGWASGTVDFGTRYSQIVKTDLSKTWTIQHSAFDYSKINRPNALLDVYRWTSNGKYLYLFPKYYPGGSGFPDSAYLSTLIHDLYRINLESGVFESVLLSTQYNDFELSSDDKILIYSEKDKPNVIHLRYMDTGHDLKITLDQDITAAGAFVWNKDNTKVVITIGYEKPDGGWYDDLSGTAFFTITPGNMHIKKILAKDSRLFIPYKCSKNDYWFSNTSLCLYSVGNDPESKNKFYSIDIETGKVVYMYPY